MQVSYATLVAVANNDGIINLFFLSIYLRPWWTLSWNAHPLHWFPLANNLRLSINATTIWDQFTTPKVLPWSQICLTSQIKNLLRRIEFVEFENKKLHYKVIYLKQLVSNIKHQENIFLQILHRKCPTLQLEILSIKKMQEEMRS